MASLIHDTSHYYDFVTLPPDSAPPAVSSLPGGLRGKARQKRLSRIMVSLTVCFRYSCTCRVSWVRVPAHFYLEK